MSFDGPAYIHNIFSRLVNEFEMSQRAGPPGLIGAAKEHPARVQLQSLMPGGVSVGSGLVVDSFGAVSRQQDIVIYESLCPIFTINGAPEATYYPVEGVIAVGEVKSLLGKSELQDVVAKSASVKALRRHAIVTDTGLGDAAVSYRSYGNGTSFATTPEDQFDQDRHSLHQIYSFALCHKFQASAQTTLGHFVAMSREAGLDLAPNNISSLDDGFIVPHDVASNTVVRSLAEGDGAIFSANPSAGFAQLLRMLRTYIMMGKTVDRNAYERYFYPAGQTTSQIMIDCHAAIPRAL